MADRAGYVGLGSTTVSSASIEHDIRVDGYFARTEAANNTPTVYCFMRGQDVDAPPPPAAPTYRYWRVIGEPDFDASEYSGPKSGASPLSPVVLLRKR